MGETCSGHNAVRGSTTNGRDGGSEPPHHHPVFVLTHHAREPIVMEGGTTFRFVTEGLESALIDRASTRLIEARWSKICGRSRITCSQRAYTTGLEATRRRVNMRPHIDVITLASVLARCVPRPVLRTGRARSHVWDKPGLVGRIARTGSTSRTPVTSRAPALPAPAGSEVSRLGPLSCLVGCR
jgi:hypothetical protein